MLVVALTAPPLLQGCTRLPAQARLADPAAQALPYPALLPYDQLPHPASSPPVTDPGPALQRDKVIDGARRLLRLPRIKRPATN